jgi:hypothetical protein
MINNVDVIGFGFRLVHDILIEDSPTSSKGSESAEDDIIKPVLCQNKNSKEEQEYPSSVYRYAEKHIYFLHF